MTKRITIIAALALTALTFAANPANAAEGFIKGGEDKFTFTGGVIVSRFDSSVAFNGVNIDGTDIDLSRNGPGKNFTNVELSGGWRITPRNRVTALWYGTKRSQTFTLAEDVQIGDEFVPAGATLTPTVKDDFFFVNYRYSFVKNDNVEIAGLLGLYGATFKFDVAAKGYPGDPTRTYSQSQSTGLPLPLIGASIDWYIMPRWQAGASLSGIKAKIGDVDGSDWVLTASTDYMIWRNFGVGIAYIHSAIDVDVTKSNFNGSINWKTNNVLLYAVAKF